jgi:hypothetical protein
MSIKSILVTTSTIHLVNNESNQDHYFLYSLLTVLFDREGWYKRIGYYGQCRFPMVIMWLTAVIRSENYQHHHHHR